jgi:RecJ-like exonuclease
MTQEENRMPRSNAEIIADLLEVRREITRVNQAAGHTVFNPTATSALSAIIAEMEEGGA